MTLAIACIPLSLLSFLSFWRPNAALFIITGIMGVFIGLYWYDIYVTGLGLAIGLALILYGLTCFGYAFRFIFGSK